MPTNIDFQLISITLKGIEALEILDEFPESDVFIIPVRLEAINISDSRLEPIQYVDLFPS
jgi:hypothetical protein